MSWRFVLFQPAIHLFSAVLWISIKILSVLPEVSQVGLLPISRYFLALGTTSGRLKGNWALREQNWLLV
jgi:hypothetical protein